MKVEYSWDGVWFLSLDASKALEIPFSKEEILATLSSLSRDKASSSNGFFLLFGNIVRTL